MQRERTSDVVGPLVLPRPRSNEKRLNLQRPSRDLDTTGEYEKAAIALAQSGFMFCDIDVDFRL